MVLNMKLEPGLNVILHYVQNQVPENQSNDNQVINENVPSNITNKEDKTDGE